MFRIKRALGGISRLKLKYIVYIQLAIAILLGAVAVFFLWVDFPSLIMIALIMGFWMRVPLKLHQILNNRFLYKNKTPEEIIRICTSDYFKKRYFLAVVTMFSIIVLYIQVLLTAKYIDFLERVTKTSIDGLIIFSASMALWAVVSSYLMEADITITKYEKLRKKEATSKGEEP